jgi:hypothetical protein
MTKLMNTVDHMVLTAMTAVLGIAVMQSVQELALPAHFV